MAIEMTIPMKKAISRLKIKQEKKVTRKTDASSRVAWKQSLISDQFIRVGTVVIRRAAKAASGMCFTRGQRKKMMTAVKMPLRMAAKRVLACIRKLKDVRVALPEAGIEP